MKEWFWITVLYSFSTGAAIYSKTENWVDTLTGAFASLPIWGLVSGFTLVVLTFAESQEFRKLYYEAQMAKWRPVPRWQDDEPEQDGLARALPPNPEGFSPVTHDLPELVRLAKLLQSSHYSIRSRNGNLSAEDYENTRQLFGQLEGVTYTKGKEMNLTDYGVWLVDWLCNLSPADVSSPSIRVLRRLKQANTHTATQESR